MSLPVCKLMLAHQANGSACYCPPKHETRARHAAAADPRWHRSIMVGAKTGVLEHCGGGKARCAGAFTGPSALQAVQRGLQQLEPGPSEAVVDALRIVDAYIKAFYLPWGPELRRWAQTHPEYTRPQLLALVTCIAEANTLKRKDRAALLQQIEADLGEVRIGRT